MILPPATLATLEGVQRMADRAAEQHARLAAAVLAMYAEQHRQALEALAAVAELPELPDGHRHAATARYLRRRCHQLAPEVHAATDPDGHGFITPLVRVTMYRQALEALAAVADYVAALTALRAVLVHALADLEHRPARPPRQRCQRPRSLERIRTNTGPHAPPALQLVTCHRPGETPTLT